MAKIRTAYFNEAEEISTVLAKSWKAAYRGIVDDDYLDALPYNHWVDFLTSGLNNNSITVVVLEDEQQIVGAAIISKTENVGECCLISFYLLPNKIGQGFGHNFYIGIEKELKNKGYLSCILDVIENNTRARRFYEAHGFRVLDKVIYVTLGGKSYTCKVYEKALE